MMKRKFVGRLKDGEEIEIPFVDGDIVIDCGANVGDVSAPFVDGGATVFAYEPNTSAYEVLSDRFKDRKNIVCINRAVSDNNGTAKLYLHEHNDKDPVMYSTGSSLNSKKTNIDVEAYETIDVVDLSEVIEKIKHKLGKNIHILKIDIEGAECEVIEKLMDKNLLSDISYVLVETHEKKNPSLVEPTKKMIERAAKEGLTNINFSWI